MRRSTKILAAAMLGLLALSSPSAAQQTGNAAGVQSTLPPNIAAELNRSVAGGNPDQIAAVMAGFATRQPELVREMSRALGSLADARGEAFLGQVAESVSRQLSTAISGDRGQAALAQFTAGITVGALSSGAPSSAKSQAVISAISSSALSGAAKTEADLGKMARIVANSVVEGVAASGVQNVSGQQLATAIQQGVSAGATKVAGSQIVVNIVASGSKVVDDVILTKNGVVLDDGRSGRETPPDGPIDSSPS